jgi:hypothetical protein
MPWLRSESLQEGAPPATFGGMREFLWTAVLAMALPLPAQAGAQQQWLVQYSSMC